MEFQRDFAAISDIKPSMIARDFYYA